MTTTKTIYAFIAFSLLFASCKNATQQQEFANSASTSQLGSSSPDSARAIIRTAEIQFQVDKVPEKINEIQTAVNQMNGRVIQYEINSNKIFQQEVACSADSSEVINQLNPTGFMKVKVPVQYADTFIHIMLTFQADIDKLNMDEQDITEDLNEKKGLIASQVEHNNSSHSLKGRMYDDDQREKQLHEKAMLDKLNHRSNYLWFDIYLKGNPLIDRHRIASTKQIHVSFGVNASNAFYSGMYGFSICLVLLLNIWPFVLLGILIFLAIKQKWVQKMFALRK